MLLPFCQLGEAVQEFLRKESEPPRLSDSIMFEVRKTLGHSAGRHLGEAVQELLSIIRTNKAQKQNKTLRHVGFVPSPTRHL